jgi:hypothetical protein
MVSRKLEDGDKVSGKAEDNDEDEATKTNEEE